MKKNKTSNAPSSNTSDSSALLSSNIIPQEVRSGKIKQSSSDTETKVSLTLLPAHRQEGSSPSKSKRKAGVRLQNNLSFSEKSEKQAASESLPFPSMTLWRKYSLLPKAIILWATYRIGKMLINRRNRPMTILIHPDPRLKRISEPVDFNNTNRKQRVTIVRKLGATLAKQGYGMKLGIAAPQIGINLRIIVVRGNVMFNPEWRPSNAPYNQITEGCYSAPKRLFKVNRAPYGWAKWTNIDGKPFEDKLTGIAGIVFQHEVDHLNGNCCVDIGEEIK